MKLKNLYAIIFSNSRRKTIMVYKVLSFSNKIADLRFQEMQVAIHPKGLLVEITDSKYNVSDYHLSNLDLHRFAISYKNLDKYLFTEYNCFKTQNLDLSYLRKAAEFSSEINVWSELTSGVSVKINGVDHSNKFAGIDKLYGSKAKNAVRIIFGETNIDARITPENPNIQQWFNLYKTLGLEEKEAEILDTKELETKEPHK